MKKHLAILPFKSDTPAHQYLGDGIADELHSSLTRLEDLHMPPAVDEMTFHTDERDVKEAAALLGVRYVLTGRVAFDGNDFDITAVLHDTESGSKLMEDRQQAASADIGDALDHILDGLTSALEARPVTGRLTVKKGWTTNPEAYIDYLRGLAFYRTIGAAKNLKAQEAFEQAIKKDNRFAKAWARLAESYAKHFIYHDASDTKRIENAGKAAANALKLEPSYPRPHAILGLVKSKQRDYVGAEDEFQKAIEMHPLLFDAWFWRAQSAFEQGLLKRAIEYFEKASEVQPQDYQALLLLRQAYMSAGRPDDSRQAAIRGIQVAKAHLKMNSRDARAIYLVAGSMFQIGQYNDALQWAERALEVDPDDPMTNYNVACCFAQAGEKEKALDCLEKVTASNIVSASWMKNDSDLFSLHDEARFQALLPVKQA